MNGHFSKEDIQMVNKHKETFTTINARKIKIKTTMRYHFVPIRIAIIFFKTWKIDVGEDVETFELLHFAGGNVKWRSFWRKQYNIF